MAEQTPIPERKTIAGGKTYMGNGKGGLQSVYASNSSVVSAYEKRIAKLEREKLVAEEQLTQCGIALRSRSNTPCGFW